MSTASRRHKPPRYNPPPDQRPHIVYKFIIFDPRGWGVVLCVGVGLEIYAAGHDWRVRLPAGAGCVTLRTCCSHPGAAHQAVMEFGAGQMAVMFRSWEGNRRIGTTAQPIAPGS